MSASGRLPRDGLKLRKLALAYPEAYEELPWGHHAIKVKGKSFLFLAADREIFSLSAKLPSSRDVAVKLPFASPTEYGLGRSGWVTARFPRAAKIPVKTLELWIEESYRAIAPKRLVRALLILLLVTVGRAGSAEPQSRLAPAPSPLFDSGRPGREPTLRWVQPDTAKHIHATYWREGALVGGGLGALGGAVVGYDLCKNDDDPDNHCLPLSLGGALVGAIILGIPGALIGGAFSKAESPDTSTAQ
jgi:hypothetical protein